MSRLSRRQVIGLMVLLAAAICAACLRMLVYRSAIDLSIEFAWPAPSVERFRLTALAVGVIVGAALGVSGVLLQALLRNPLAEPYILGVSSGAGLGVMAALYAAHQWAALHWLHNQQAPAAMIGGAAVLALVYLLGQRRGVLDPVSLVLVGVVISTICGAAIMFLQHAVGTGLRGEFTLWLMGNIDEAAPRQTLLLAAAVTVAGLVAGTGLGRAMDAATLGDDEARSVGVPLGPTRFVLFALASILASITVALAGPIGFVGLVSPHAARLILGPRHGLLVIGAALAGVVMVVGSDAARQMIDVGAGRMPIGIFTAAIGGPAFIALLLSGKGQS